ncbi:MAG: hypothetical protein WBM13_10610 [Bacteroidia bacterium]
MTEVNFKGSLETVVGMAVMAHKFGINSDIILLDGNSDRIWEYGLSLREAPVENWTLDPKVPSDVKDNQRAVLFKLALCEAAEARFSQDAEELEDIAVDHFYYILKKQTEEVWALVSEYNEWSEAEVYEEPDICGVFYDKALDNWTQAIIDRISDEIMVNDFKISARKLRKLITTEIPFGEFQYRPLADNSDWSEALLLQDKSFI